MKKHTDTTTESAFDLAKRGVLVVNATARDKVLTRLIGVLPPAFMHAAEGYIFNAQQTPFLKPESRLSSRKSEVDMGLLYFGVHVSERLTHLIPDCHPEPHPH